MKLECAKRKGKERKETGNKKGSHRRYEGENRRKKIGGTYKKNERKG